MWVRIPELPFLEWNNERDRRLEDEKNFIMYEE